LDLSAAHGQGAGRGAEGVRQPDDIA